MKYYGLIIPRSYNDYFSRSDPQAIQQLVRNMTDSTLNAASTNPIQNKPVAEAIGAINDVIPAQASDTNQLADKEFVNSSVGTNTANYISDNGNPFASVAALEAYAGTVTNNDYAFVTGTDSAGNTYYDRYKATVSGATVSWAKEYRLNNSSFTAEQWAAIQSGITAAKVAQYDAALVVADEVEKDNMKPVTSNAVAESKSYTSAETLTGGTWIDGKAIYRKVINGTLTIGQESSIQLSAWSNFSDIDTLIKLEGTFKQVAGGSTTFFKMSDSGARLYIAQSGSPNGLVFDSKNGRTNVPYQVTVEYTKN